MGQPLRYGRGSASLFLLLGTLRGESLFDRARALQAQGQYGEAETQYRAFLREQPRSIPALTNLGVVLARESKFEEAIDAYQRALSLDASATPAKINLALAYYRTSEWLSAAKWFQAALEDNPDDRRALQLLAISYIQSRQYSAAANAYERLLPSTDPPILIGLSTAYREIGKRAESERILTTVLQQSSQSAEVQYLLGLAQYARQDYSEAVQSFTKTITLAPTRADGYFYLGATYFKQRKFEDAIGTWRSGVNADPQYFPSIFALGALLAELNRYTEAKPYLEQALTARPRDAATQLEMGRLYLREGRLQAALPLLESAAKLDPKSQQTSFLLAGAYQKVINAYALKGIDIDIENTDEFQNNTVQDRILSALKIIKTNNPSITTVVTFGTTTTGPDSTGTRLINQSKALGSNIDVYTIMPFDFGGSNMVTDTENATNGLRDKLKTAFGWSNATAYAHIGISGMNGKSDNAETTSTANWTSIRDWSKTNGLARLSFWSVNRDRQCASGGQTDSCSGVSQSSWAFTKINAGF